jgi:hypothetical protein
MNIQIERDRIAPLATDLTGVNTDGRRLMAHRTEWFAFGLVRILLSGICQKASDTALAGISTSRTSGSEARLRLQKKWCAREDSNLHELFTH